MRHTDQVIVVGSRPVPVSVKQAAAAAAAAAANATATTMDGKFLRRHTVQ